MTKQSMIDELWGKALDKAASETYSTLTWIQVEKVRDVFVDLFIQEVCRALWNDECHTSDLANEEYQNNCKKIKEHFGVE